MTPTTKSDDARNAAWLEALKLVEQIETRVPVDTTPITWHLVICAILLALRHPVYKKSRSAQLIEQFAHKLADHLAQLVNDPDYTSLLEAGFDRTQDLKAEPAGKD